MKKPQALIGLLAALGTVIGVLVAVVGLPYGRANYTAFADLYHNGGTPALGMIDLAIDCDTGSIGVQDTCNVVLPAASTSVAVTIGNNTASATSVGTLNFRVLHPEVADMDAPAVAGPFCDQNPDFNQAYLSGAGFSCSPPAPDDDLGGNPPGEDSFLSAFTGSADGPVLANDGVHQTLATVTYTITGAIIGDTEVVTLADAAISDNSLSEIGSCAPVISVAAACFSATITFVAPPPATVTLTPVPATVTPIPPSPTNTPAGPTVNKVPECDEGGPLPEPDNCDLSDPGEPLANLWLCEGLCDQPGEGSLHVHEVATNVDTAPAGPGGPGLGAYEFQVEYDNFVIASVNACDVVFGTAVHIGDGNLRGPVDEVGPVGSSPNAECADDSDISAPNPATNGQCTMSLINENSVRFGCVTVGDLPVGPETPPSPMLIASLELIPHEDLKADIFPGNNNGVVTIIKDSGCELVDVLGHAVLGSINGGLTLECGNLVVTVRILEGDLNLDCEVTVTDAQIIASKYGSFFGSLIYGKWYDLEPALHDLDIDIKDLQKVFGRIGSDCQEPVPAQPPVDFSP